MYTKLNNAELDSLIELFVNFRKDYDTKRARILNAFKKNSSDIKDVAKFNGALDIMYATLVLDKERAQFDGRQ